MTLPRLQRAIAARPELLELPEKVVQFGTGAFLRGFVEYFIDEANRRGHFGGRIVAVGSTGSGRDRVLSEQDGLYTLAIRGIVDGAERAEYRQISALSRALSATSDWTAVLECARNPALELIFSNTTETGIQLDELDQPGPETPRTFPGKLTAFLYERARHFDFAPHAGPVVLPCELIEDNGSALKSVVLQLARIWQLDARFIDWIDHAVPFCNTLVDRIVPGEPAPHAKEQMWQELGYRDELLTVCEVYRLFAIEAHGGTAERLGFARADDSIIIADDIAPYRKRKLRLLNGTHTVSVPAALLAGCETVSQAVADEQVGAFIRRVLLGELVPSTDVLNAEGFARQVLDRFSNPFIRHALVDITLQQTLKMRVRVVPAIIDFARGHGHAPSALATGFAAYLLYVRDAAAVKPDDGAAQVRALMQDADLARAVAGACSAQDVWGIDLSEVPEFVNRVTEAARLITERGMRAALEQQPAGAGA